MKRAITWETGTPDRYARLRLIDWWDQAAVARASVMVVGCGALGNEVVRLLALVGIGRLVVVDPDRIELHNLTRAAFFRDTDVGRFKASVIARRARQLNPAVQVEPVVGYVETHIGLGKLKEMSAVACCVDSIGARVALSRMCYRAGVPWVNGGISPTEGEVTAFGASRPPCYVCTVSKEMWEREQEAQTCRGFQAVAATKPVATTAAAASVVAAFQVQQILGRLSPSSSAPRCLEDGQKAYLRLAPPFCWVTSLAVDPNCDSHEVYEPIVSLQATTDRTTAQDVLNIAGCPDGTLMLDRELVLRVRYPCCGRSKRVGRPLRLCTEDLLICPGCSKQTGHADIVTEVRSSDRVAARPLTELGIPPRDIVKVTPRNGGTPIYVSL